MQEDDSGQEKTEQPTQKRLEKAEEDGHVLRSQEFTIAILVLGCLLILITRGKVVVDGLLGMYRVNFDFDGHAEQDIMREHIALSLGAIAGDLLLFLCSSVGIAIAANVVLGGVKFNLKSASFKPGRLNPFSGLKRIFGTRSLYELGKSVLKTGLILGVTLAVFLHYSDQLFFLALLPGKLGIAAAGSILAAGVFLIALSLVLIALFDVPFKIHEFRQKLLMTRQEIKDEYKESEGRPEIRRRIRERQREIAFNKMMKAVEKADVVVTNPEHFAVALSYSPGGEGAPTVLGKGADHMALQIKRKCEELGIPVFEAPALARALYFTTQVNDQIPEALYHAVAEVIAYVFNMSALLRYGKLPPRPNPVVPASMLFDADGKPLPDPR
jgi:flagellar biosynthetic protein FlhB